MICKKVYLTSMMVFLIIFSIETVYDTCVQRELNISLMPSASLLSLAPDSSSSSPVIHTDYVDCHCPCHFAFNSEMILDLALSSPFQPLVLSVTDLLMETPISGILRPPIYLL
jgi:hypothetical protein